MSSGSAPEGLDASQQAAIAIAERVASGFSLVGLTFIIVTFILIPAIRKPIHCLMFYAAWGDVFYNVATFIATAGIDAGQGSSLCQFQGFTIEMFLWTDTLWNLAMAIDVYLTVFHRYESERVRALERLYIGGIYGFSFLLAFALCFAQDSERGKMYGPAVLWCWISLEWDFMRMVALYAPVWIMIAAIGVIYVVAGLDVYRKDREIRQFAGDVGPEQILTTVNTTFSRTPGDRRSSASASWDSDRREGSPSDTTTDVAEAYQPPRSGARGIVYKQYSVTVESAPRSPRSPWRPHSAEAGLRPRSEVQLRRDLNSAAWAYTKCASLFFLALLITWLPSTVNRVYALVHPEIPSYPLNLSAAIVLPLMGFWNTCIYAFTSWSTLKSVWSDWSVRHGARRPPSVAQSHRTAPTRPQSTRMSAAAVHMDALEEQISTKAEIN